MDKYDFRKSSSGLIPTNSLSIALACDVRVTGRFQSRNALSPSGEAQLACRPEETAYAVYRDAPGVVHFNVSFVGSGYNRECNRVLPKCIKFVTSLSPEDSK
jgi:hypothetical protein